MAALEDPLRVQEHLGKVRIRVYGEVGGEESRGKDGVSLEGGLTSRVSSHDDNKEESSLPASHLVQFLQIFVLVCSAANNGKKGEKKQTKAADRKTRWCGVANLP